MSTVLGDIVQVNLEILIVVIWVLYIISLLIICCLRITCCVLIFQNTDRSFRSTGFTGDNKLDRELI